MERDLKKVLETLKSHEADNELLNDVLPVSYTHLTLPTICSV